MPPITGQGKRFLLLQGPHGPFFSRLGRHLTDAGGEVWRVGFNISDQIFWHDKGHYIRFDQPLEMWPEFCAGLLSKHQITDIVLYGDARPIHREAVAQARALGLSVHVFEEGYMRPYWVTYERGGSNGNSRLMQIPVSEMERDLAAADLEAPIPPDHWGEMREHVFWGFCYHAMQLLLNSGYRAFRSHREIPVSAEFRLYLARLFLMPFQAIERRLTTGAIKRSGFPYHIVLLQLAHDSNFLAHGSVGSMAMFIDEVCRGFANGAPPHHRLVFKAHPLEDDRVDLRRLIRGSAEKHGITRRVRLLRGGKLAWLLNDARSAVTVNSTAAQQVLWRAIPLKCFGNAVYSKPEFVSDQPIEAFFADPLAPDSEAYALYRRYLLETSQLAGGYYSRRGRRQLLRQVVDLMLAVYDPYDSIRNKPIARRRSRPNPADPQGNDFSGGSVSASVSQNALNKREQ